MSLPAVPPNAYTDAPKPHPNLILGSLQLLFWLLFHPSAWRNHIVRIDSTLRPDFWLIELSPAQWRNPALRRLLIQGYVVWPLLGCLLVGLELLVLGESGRNIAFDLAFGVASGVVVSMANSVAVGVTLGVVYAVGNAVAKAVATSIAFGVTGGLAFGMAGSVVFGVARQKPTYSLAKQIGGVVVGVQWQLLLRRSPAQPSRRCWASVAAFFSCPWARGYNQPGSLIPPILRALG